MSDFFNPNDFGEWKEITKAISDHLRDNPGTSNPSKIMHVIASKFGCENTQAFKSMIESASLSKIISTESSLQSLCIFGTVDQIVDKVKSLMPIEKTQKKIEDQEKAMWLIDRIAKLYFSNVFSNEINTIENFLACFDAQKLAEICRDEVSYLDCDNRDEFEYIYRELNQWYTSLPGNNKLSDIKNRRDYFYIIPNSSCMNSINRIMRTPLQYLSKEANYKSGVKLKSFYESLTAAGSVLFEYLSESESLEEIAKASKEGLHGFCPGDYEYDKSHNTLKNEIDNYFKNAYLNNSAWDDLLKSVPVDIIINERALKTSFCKSALETMKTVIHNSWVEKESARDWSKPSFGFGDDNDESPLVDNREYIITEFKPQDYTIEVSSALCNYKASQQ